METKERKRERKTEKTPNKKKTKKINYWKIAFLVLIGLILGSTVFLYTRVTANREPSYTYSKKAATPKEDPAFQVQLKKEQINQIISFYLNDFLKDSGIKYSFYLEDQALLNGTFKILGHEMQFYLYFEPYVMENGNVRLKANSISIGTLSLPMKDIMNYIAKNFDMPKWVEVIPKEQTITLHLDEFKLKNGMYAKAEKINLIDDDIRFNVYLPISNKEGK